MSAPLLTREDLRDLSLEELKELQKIINSAVDDYYKVQVEKALAEAQQLADKYGVDVADAISGLQKSETKKQARATRAKKAPKIKYQHPYNRSLSWTGRGRTPTWIEDLLEGGMTMDELRAE